MNASISLYLALGVGGVAGVYARYGLTHLVHRLCGPGFPFGTLFVNVLGSFLLAFLFVVMLERASLAPAWRAGILTGGLGAFTTFSTFVVEALQLIESGETFKALAYIGLSVVLAMGVAWAALVLARAF